MDLVKEKIKKAIKDFSWFKLIILLLLIVFSALFVYLLYWAIITSFKLNKQDFRINPLGLPQKWVIENYQLVIKEFGPLITVNGVQQKVGVLKMIFHSVFFSVGCAVIATLVPCLMAYIVVRFPCTLSKIYYGIVIVTMILPIVGAYPAEIQMLQSLNLYNKLLTPWVQKFNFLGMYFLVFHGMIRTLGKEYWEAAYIDGAGQFTVLFHIILPLLRNTIGLVILLLFIQFWNDYQTPLLYVPSYPTIAYGIYDLSNTFDRVMSSVPMKMTACIVFVMPILLLYIVFKDKLMGNVTMGGIKE
jgi:ABC-type glycerol-3-phosphate transport system permease component